LPIQRPILQKVWDFFSNKRSIYLNGAKISRVVA
jgi:hypothetical protein